MIRSVLRPPIWRVLRCVVVGVFNVPCYHPQAAWRTPSTGSVVFVGPGQFTNLTLPCGQCIGCRQERSRQWAVRIMHEAALHTDSCFITLTYSEANCPEDMSLDKRDLQKFFKRLRKHHDVRYYACGEYGPLHGRPHFHACVFGWRFPDRVKFGSNFDRSLELESLWRLGNSSVGDVTFDTAGYTAGYICDKKTGFMAKRHYEFVVPSTGEIIQKQPERAWMSLKPGIGSDFYDKYREDIYPHDYVVVRGVKCKPPRYYDKKFEAMFADEFEKIRLQREMDAELRFLDNTPARLAVREQCVRAAVVKRTKEF
ncbi:MAG: replication initiator protein [Microviridae sp.]|nr:MAG: replication initiator protein [Microviridae sp.]